MVYPNLYYFLQCYPEHFECYFWIDQISIDQIAVGERNYQVPLMGHIFSNAQQVVVWLDSDPAIGTLLD